jgi:hypothetical protein
MGHSEQIGARVDPNKEAQVLSQHFNTAFEIAQTFRTEAQVFFHHAPFNPAHVLQGPTMRQQARLVGIRTKAPVTAPTVLSRIINLHAAQVPVLQGLPMRQQARLVGIRPPFHPFHKAPVTAPTVLSRTINLHAAQVPVLQGPPMRQQARLVGIRPPLDPFHKAPVTAPTVLSRTINLHAAQVPVLQGPPMRQQARLVGIRPPLRSLTQGAEQEQQELRQSNRMLQQGDSTECAWA